MHTLKGESGVSSSLGEQIRLFDRVKMIIGAVNAMYSHPLHKKHVCVVIKYLLTSVFCLVMHNPRCFHH